MKNWAGNQTYSTEHVVIPESTDQLSDIVAQSNKIKALGTRHSFNQIGDSEHTLISLQYFNKLDIPNPDSKTITIGGGINYGQLATHLQSHGWAIHNMASLPHISVAGACATATHGSGIKNGNLATAVKSIQIIEPSGELKTYDGSELEKRIVHLGALGIITELTLQIEPTFNAHQSIYENLSFEEFTQSYKHIFATGYSVSLFTNWIDNKFGQVWVKSRADENPESVDHLFGATKATKKLHPLPELSPVNCTEQLGSIHPWHEILPHFRMEFTPSAGEELQSEFFINVNDAPQALEAIASFANKISPELFVSELRYVAADNLIMSPAYHQDVVAFHFTWKQNWERVQPVLDQIEQLLAPFKPRPHFGKLFINTAQLAANYPNLQEFKNLAHTTDPTGKFTNQFLKQLLK